MPHTETEKESPSALADSASPLQASASAAERSGFLILVVNPGSTSTKVGVYRDEHPVFVSNICHSVSELARFDNVTDQYRFRKALVLRELEAHGVPFRFDAIIGRGGLGKPVHGGVYAVNELFCHDMLHAKRRHACNLGCPIAYELAGSLDHCLALTADPVVVDEMEDVARVTGSPLMQRRAIWHALNQRAIAHRFARERGVRYEDLNLIVCHLGGGISVAAHRRGRAVDVNNALDGEGPFSPERAGTLPTADLIHLCFSGKYTRDQLLRRVAGEAGLAAHIGTTDVRVLISKIAQGDSAARLLVDAMIYQTAKAIAAEAAVFCGEVDAVLLTGGMAHSDYIVGELRRRVAFLAPVSVYPGEGEMEALAQNALAVLRGEQEAYEYA